jgi:arylsulfatase A-like enzyme
MKPSAHLRRILILVVAAGAIAVLSAQSARARPHNVIIFVADGLRAGSVSAIDTPALWGVRTNGVNFSNSHSVFPSLTMPNAAAIATGHDPGDTGQFANNLFSGFPQFDTGNFGRSAGSLTQSTENNLILADLDDHFGGRYLGEPTLLELARHAGFSTAALGKTGPTALQDVGELNPSSKKFKEPTTIILDDAAGTAEGVPVTPEVVAWLKAAGLAPSAPPRHQPAGTYTTPGTLTPNVAHQQWYADAITKAILPKFRERGKPFLLVFWSGDPDQTQHAQGDSLNRLVPGVNGPTSKAAVRNADHNLKQILDYVNANPDLRDSTDMFLTADHGFSTVSRREIDAAGHVTQSYSARFIYRDVTGMQLLGQGALPNNFLAVDLAHALELPLYDGETVMTDDRGVRFYQAVDPTAQPSARVRQMPSGSSAVIGGTGRVTTPVDARVVVASQSIYVLGNSREMIARIVRFLSRQDYIGGIFVNDAFGEIPGALPMSDIRLMGRSAKLPRPAIVVSFRNFATDSTNPLMTGVILGGTQQQGQGNHGSLSRANTFNNMAAIGPDFKRQFIDRAPIGNADVAPTLAFILGMTLPRAGGLGGRVLREALTGGPSTVPYEHKTVRSKAAESGKSTVLMYQEAGGVRYLDEADFK